MKVDLDSSKAGSDGRASRNSLLAEAVERYGGALSRFFERRVDNKSDVADLVQDVFLRLAKLRDISTIEKFESYMFVTASSVLRDRARRHATRGYGRHEDIGETIADISNIAADQLIEDEQAIDQLHQVISELPERTRDIFVLRVFEDMRIADIAQLLGISRRAAEKHFARAMAHVATRIDK